MGESCAHKLGPGALSPAGNANAHAIRCTVNKEAWWTQGLDQDWFRSSSVQGRDGFLVMSRAGLMLSADSLPAFTYVYTKKYLVLIYWSSQFRLSASCSALHPSRGTFQVPSNIDYSMTLHR